MDLLVGPGGYLLIPPVFTRWVDMGCLLRLSVKMLLDGLRDRRNHEKSLVWIERLSWMSLCKEKDSR